MATMSTEKRGKIRSTIATTPRLRNTGWFPKECHSVVLADVPPYRNFLQKSFPAVLPWQKNAMSAAMTFNIPGPQEPDDPRPPFCKTALLFPLDKWLGWEGLVRNTATKTTHNACVLSAQCSSMCVWHEGSFSVRHATVCSAICPPTTKYFIQIFVEWHLRGMQIWIWKDWILNWSYRSSSPRKGPDWKDAPSELQENTFRQSKRQITYASVWLQACAPLVVWCWAVNTDNCQQIKHLDFRK